MCDVYFSVEQNLDIQECLPNDSNTPAAIQDPASAFTLISSSHSLVEVGLTEQLAVSGVEMMCSEGGVLSTNGIAGNGECVDMQNVLSSAAVSFPGYETQSSWDWSRAESVVSSAAPSSLPLIDDSMQTATAPTPVQTLVPMVRTKEFMTLEDIEEARGLLTSFTQATCDQPMPMTSPRSFAATSHLPPPLCSSTSSSSEFTQQPPPFTPTDSQVNGDATLLSVASQDEAFSPYPS